LKFCPTSAVSVRQLHDIDHTGWWILIGVIGIGTIVLIYWACLRGTLGPNRFGPVQCQRHSAPFE
ncbi:MAG TPA: DUF805 domain-containing protein, partial [Terriglobales bacterium]|nr:DUF805 domain-containing protein [Terriglobales bacterium]